MSGIPLLVCRDELEVGAAAGRLDAADGDANRVAQADRAARVGDQRGLPLVDLPPAAAHPPDRQEAREALVAEADDQSLRDRAPDLAVELELPPRLGEPPLEQEGHADVVGVALDLHRLALGLRGVLAELEQLVAARRG